MKRNKIIVTKEGMFVIIILILVILNAIYSIGTRTIIIKQETIKEIIRETEKINILKYIIDTDINKRIDKYYQLYSNYYKEKVDYAILSRDDFNVILKVAIIEEMPFHFLLSIIYVESRFDENAIWRNINYKTGEITSFDIGYAGINNKNYPHYTIKEIFNPELNVILACDTYRKFEKIYKNSVLTTAGYNAGILTNVSKGSIVNGLIYTALVHQEVKNLNILFVMKERE